MSHCCYGNCNSDSRAGRPGYDSSIKFYPVPQPCLLLRSSVLVWDDRKQIKHTKQCPTCRLCWDWMVRCKRDDERFKMVRFITSKTRICSKHFNDTPPKMDFQKYRPLPTVYKPTSKYRREPQELTEESDSVQNFQTGHPLPNEVQLTTNTLDDNLALQVLEQSSEMPVSEIIIDDSINESPSYEVPALHDFIGNSCEMLDNYSPVYSLQQLRGTSINSNNAIGDTEPTSSKMVDAAVQVSFDSPAKLISRGCQTTWILQDINELNEKMKDLKSQVKQLKQQMANLLSEDICNISKFENQLKSDEGKCQFYTGFSLDELRTFIYFCDQNITEIRYWGAREKAIKSKKTNSTTGATRETTETAKPPLNSKLRKRKRRRRLTNTQELLLFFLRVRGGFLIKDIAYRFGFTSTYISRVVTTWILVLYELFASLKGHMFASREVISKSLPPRFKKFKNIRVIIDCAEVFCQQPSNFEQKGNCYSQYKAHTTFKVLLGCAPNGAVTFISDIFEGSISDRAIVERSGLIDLLEPGDLILADRGFTIRDLTDDKNVSLKIPAFLKGRDKLTPQEEIETKEIAANRIFIEHVVGRVKNYRIFQRLIPQSMRHTLSQTIYVCACLLNFKPPLVK